MGIEAKLIGTQAPTENTGGERKPEAKRQIHYLRAEDFLVKKDPDDEKKLESVIAQLGIPNDRDKSKKASSQLGAVIDERDIPKSRYHFSEGKPISRTKPPKEKTDTAVKQAPKKEDPAYTPEQTLAAMGQADHEANSKETTTEAERNNARLFQIFKENNVSPFHAEKLKPWLLPIVDNLKSVSVKNYEWMSASCEIKIVFNDNSKIGARGVTSEYLKGLFKNRSFNKAFGKIKKELKEKGYLEKRGREHVGV